MSLPNVHYFDVDMNRFKDSSLRNTKNVSCANMAPEQPSDNAIFALNS